MVLERVLTLTSSDYMTLTYSQPSIRELMSLSTSTSEFFRYDIEGTAS